MTLGCQKVSLQVIFMAFTHYFCGLNQKQMIFQTYRHTYVIFWLNILWLFGLQSQSAHLIINDKWFAICLWTLFIWNTCKQLTPTPPILPPAHAYQPQLIGTVYPNYGPIY